MLGDRYRLTERLGGGAMGEVWCADDGVLERQVAVKILLPSLLDDAAFMERFRREAKLLAAVNHPGIVEVYDYGESTGGSVTRVAYIVMELITGRPLDEVLAEGGPMAADQALGLVAQALDALHVAHRRQIVHRDIKPSNLMLRDDGRVVVTDFGIASAAAGTRITSSNAILGTALYVAPERAEGASSIPSSDLYSMGVLCYEMLTGEPPFTGETALEIVLKHIRQPAPALPDAFPEPVRELVAKALAKQPEDRFTSAAVMAAAARRASGTAPSAGPAMSVPADSTTIRLVSAAPDETTEPGSAPPAAATAPVEPPLVKTLVAAEKPRLRRDWRRLLIPVIIPCTITAGVGTVLLIDPSPFRSDASPSGSRPVVAVSGPLSGGASSAASGVPSSAAPTSPGAAAPSTPGAASASAPGGPPASAAAPPGSGAVPPAGGGGAGSGGGGGTTSGSGGQPVTAPQGGGNAPGQGAPAAPTTAAARPTASTPTSAPAPAPGPAAPAGCGGAGWGAIVNVGDRQKLGLAADSLAGGTRVVTGATTAYGWVHWADAFQRFNVCDRSDPALAEILTFDGSPPGVELASFNDVATAWTTAATATGSYTIKDSGGQNCLTDNGVGKPVTVVACTPGNTSQEWLLP
ncbi:serine/threonine-protein kinase [Kitasatospora mediocidica]|uniref:serine/threonine-protein kinase n=1 Tax=Kitasatospora mediocidica TaxID=58352 RepID=UPI000691198D|nr:serine/threonine-protein kinase [Kitasatospora mediocidica]